MDTIQINTTRQEKTKIFNNIINQYKLNKNNNIYDILEVYEKIELMQNYTEIFIDNKLMYKIELTKIDPIIFLQEIQLILIKREVINEVIDLIQDF